MNQALDVDEISDHQCCSSWSPVWRSSLVCETLRANRVVQEIIFSYLSVADLVNCERVAHWFRSAALENGWPSTTHLVVAIDRKKPSINGMHIAERNLLPAIKAVIENKIRHRLRRLTIRDNEEYMNSRLSDVYQTILRSLLNVPTIRLMEIELLMSNPFILFSRTSEQSCQLAKIATEILTLNKGSLCQLTIGGSNWSERELHRLKSSELLSLIAFLGDRTLARLTLESVLMSKTTFDEIRASLPAATKITLKNVGVEESSEPHKWPEFGIYTDIVDGHANFLRIDPLHFGHNGPFHRYLWTRPDLTCDGLNKLLVPTDHVTHLAVRYAAREKISLDYIVIRFPLLQSVYFEGPSFHNIVDFAQYFADVYERNAEPRSLLVSFAAAWFLRKLYGDAGPKFEQLMLDQMMKGLKKNLIVGSFDVISQRSSRQLVLTKGSATITINIQIDRPKLPDSDKWHMPAGFLDDLRAACGIPCNKAFVPGHRCRRCL
uniref:F-box domain-containing protein n=1 Tax=Plectus sambesii TaxID=2011161 RepID=A0A914VDD2_9BILA